MTSDPGTLIANCATKSELIAVRDALQREIRELYACCDADRREAESRRQDTRSTIDLGMVIFSCLFLFYVAMKVT